MPSVAAKMETIQFRTNIGCADCLKVASILLDADSQILYWQVDMDHPERLLTVKGLMVNRDMVVYNLRFAGFRAERIEGS
jgi:copper chaperone